MTLAALLSADRSPVGAGGARNSRCGDGARAARSARSSTDFGALLEVADCAQDANVLHCGAAPLGERQLVVVMQVDIAAAFRAPAAIAFEHHLLYVAMYRLRLLDNRSPDSTSASRSATRSHSIERLSSARS